MHASHQLHRPNVDRRPKLTEISRLISAMPMIIRNDRMTLLTNLAGQNKSCGQYSHSMHAKTDSIHGSVEQSFTLGIVGRWAAGLRTACAL